MALYVGGGFFLIVFEKKNYCEKFNVFFYYPSFMYAFFD